MSKSPSTKTENAASQPAFAWEALDKLDKPDAIPFDVTLLALSSIKGLGRKSLQAFVDTFKGDLSLIWKSSREQISSILTDAKIPAVENALKQILNKPSELIAQGISQIERLADRAIKVISYSELPKMLRDIPDGPRWLFVQGNSDVLYHPPAVAVVGTRKPSAHGRKATSMVARVLAAYQLVLVSGLAEGIDEEAHRASLQENVTNVAFLGHGINLVFPSSTKALREEIIDKGGAIATEYLPDEHYQKSYFVERNRLQAALADIVIPVQANPKGGTAHTIRFARKYERKIIGINWNEANGILDDLRNHGFTIIDIFTQAGCRELDSILRDLVESVGQETYAFSSIEQRLTREAKSRAIRRSDINRLLEALNKIAVELESRGPD